MEKNKSGKPSNMMRVSQVLASAKKPLTYDSIARLSNLSGFDVRIAVANLYRKNIVRKETQIIGGGKGNPPRKIVSVYMPPSQIKRFNLVKHKYGIV